MDHKLLVDNIVRVAKTGIAYSMPMVVSTVNVKTGMNKPMIPELQAVLPGVEPLDRTTINAWEDAEFNKAVKATGRKKLIMAALWTEACLSFPALDAIREGYEVYPVVDAVGGTSVEAHRAALERVVQAGGKPISLPGLVCELQRDWVRKETVQLAVEIILSAYASTP
jgi:nicotinamidase-related amidase